MKRSGRRRSTAYRDNFTPAGNVLGRGVLQYAPADFCLETDLLEVIHRFQLEKIAFRRVLGIGVVQVSERDAQLRELVKKICATESVMLKSPKIM